MLTTRWSQDSPFNLKCPVGAGSTAHAMTGCVPTAISQVVYYWYQKGLADGANYLPTSVLHTTEKYNNVSAPITDDYVIAAGTPYNWQLMENTYSASSSDESKNAVATLMATIGLSSKVVYRTTSTSGALTTTIPVLRDQFNLRSESKVRGETGDDAWAAILINQLTQGRPVAYGGVGSMGGHAFVCDGYKYENETNLFHFNLGWGTMAASTAWCAITQSAGSCGGFWQSQQILTICPESIAGAGDFTTTFTTTPFVYGQESTITVTVKNNQDPANMNSTNSSGLYVLLSPYEPDVVSQYTTKLHDLDFEANTGAAEPSSATFTFTPSYHTTYNVKVMDGGGLLLYSGTIPMTGDGTDAPAMPTVRPYVLNNFDDLTNGDIFTIVANNIELENINSSRGYLTYNAATGKLATADFISSGDQTSQQFAIIKDGEGETATYYIYNVKSHKFLPTGTFAAGAMGLLTTPNGNFSFTNVSGLPNHWFISSGSSNYLMTSAGRQVSTTTTALDHGNKWFIESVGKLSEDDLAAAQAAIEEYKNPSTEAAVDVTIDLYRDRGTFYANADCTGTSKVGNTFTDQSNTTYQAWQLNPADVTDVNGNDIPGDLALIFSSFGDYNAVGYFIQSNDNRYKYEGNSIRPLSIQTSRTQGGFRISVPDNYYIMSYEFSVHTGTTNYHTTFTTASGMTVTTGNPASAGPWKITDTPNSHSTSFTTQITAGNKYSTSTASTTTTANVRKFQVRVVNKAWLKEQAREAIAFDMPVGVGYPKTTSTAYTELTAAIQTVQTALNAEEYDDLAAALSNFGIKKVAYLDCTDVMLPETEAKVYTISFVKNDGVTKYRLRYAESGYTAQQATAAPAGSEFFYAYDAGNGKIAFRNFDNRWLVFKGSDRGQNSLKGYLDNRDDTYCAFTVAKLASSTYVTLGREMIFGKMSLSAISQGTTTDFFTISVNAQGVAAFNQGSAAFYRNDYYSAIVFEEVSEDDRRAGMPTMTSRFHSVYGDSKCGDLDAAAAAGDAAAYFDALEDLADIKFTFSYVDESNQPITNVRIIAEGGRASNEEQTVQWKTTSVKLMGKDYQLYSSYKFVVGSTEYSTWADLKAAYPTPANVNVKVVFGAKTGLNNYAGKYYTIRNKSLANRLVCFKPETGTDKVGSGVKARPLVKEDINYVFRFEDAGDGRFYIYSVGGNSYAKRFNKIAQNTACEMTPAAQKSEMENAYRIVNGLPNGDATLFGIVAASDVDNPLPVLNATGLGSFWHVNTSQANGCIIRWNVTGDASRWYIEEVEVPTVTIVSVTSDEGTATGVTIIPTNSDAGLVAENKILSWTTSLAFGGDYAYHRLTGGSLTVGGTTTNYTSAADFYTAMNALTQDATATLTISNRYTVTHNYVLGGTTKTLQNATTETVIAGPYTPTTSPTITNYTFVNTSWTDGGVLADDVTITYNYRMTNLPFEASTLESDGSFGSGMKWYRVRQQDDNGHWNCSNGTITNAKGNAAETRNNATVNTEELLKQKSFAFVPKGDGSYYIYSYNEGPSKVVSISTETMPMENNRNVTMQEQYCPK